ncbi:J domain-containing protein [Meloidogyne graminicola]|uniref:J domain-containing protein n=1 Tax=Meloidogyne graminicola TaxID=189291 RepID=A0A8S9ZPQ0_9BILA|nr:J domain-containing protein [Meloidogyne graminicola]
MTKSVLKDYYEIINVSVTACNEDIKKAYRRQALKLHPDKNKADCAEDKFKKLMKFYLTQQKERLTMLNDVIPQIWPIFSVLLHSIAIQEHLLEMFFNCHTYANRCAHPSNNKDVKGRRNGNFRQSQPFTKFYTPPPNFSTPPPPVPRPTPPQPSSPPPPPKQDEAILYDLKVNLEEICNGTTRKIRIGRELHGVDGILRKEEEVLPIEIKPGWKEGTKITYPKKGDVYPGRIPADIVFMIKEEKHSLFERDGSTLRCNMEIHLSDALIGRVTVPNLGGPDFEINFGKPIQPGTVHWFHSNTYYPYSILGGGLPDRKDECRRGQLVVTFFY